MRIPTLAAVALIVGAPLVFASSALAAPAAVSVTLSP